MNRMGPPPDAALYRVGLRVLHRMAHGFWRRYGGCIELDELVSAGLPAVTAAVRRYDAQRGLFRPYLVRRLRWTFLDQVRKRIRRRLDPARGLPLGVASVVSEGRVGIIFEGSDELPRISSVLGSGAQPGHVSLGGDLAEVAMADEAGPEVTALRRDRLRAIRRALDKLPSREQILIARHYFAGQMLREIAADFEVSISTISRLHREAIAALETHLRSFAEDDP